MMMRMIFDHEGAFPGSCVHYTRFDSFFMRQMFAVLREREQILQSEVGRGERSEIDRHSLLNRMQEEIPEMMALIRLREVERILIWVATNNITTRKDEQARGRRRVSSSKQVEMF